MKKGVLFALVAFTGCNMTQLVNDSTCSINQNIQAVESSTCKVQENTRLVRESTKGLEQNLKNLENM